LNNSQGVSGIGALLSNSTYPASKASLTSSAQLCEYNM